VDDAQIGPMLRLSRDREGHDLLPTPDEAEAKAREANGRLQAEVDALRAELARATGKPNQER
jgi:hypothetical protein